MSLHFGCEHRWAGDSDGDDGEDEDRRKARDFFTFPSSKESSEIRLKGSAFEFQTRYTVSKCFFHMVAPCCAFAKVFTRFFGTRPKMERLQGPMGPYG